MSRIGKKVIELPENVEIKVEGNVVTVKGPKGELTREIPAELTVMIEENEVTVSRPNDTNVMRSLHGTTRSNIANMIEGVSTGFEKRLELTGVGYRALQQGTKLELNVGLSHPVSFEPEEGIEIEVPANNQIIVKGYDKEKVGQLAASIRAVRPPEPYKGKGIRYENEFVIRKEGKTGK